MNFVLFCQRVHGKNTILTFVLLWQCCPPVIFKGNNNLRICLPWVCKRGRHSLCFHCPEQLSSVQYVNPKTYYGSRAPKLPPAKEPAHMKVMNHNTLWLYDLWFTPFRIRSYQSAFCMWGWLINLHAGHLLYLTVCFQHWRESILKNPVEDLHWAADGSHNGFFLPDVKIAAAIIVTTCPSVTCSAHQAPLYRWSYWILSRIGWNHYDDCSHFTETQESHHSHFALCYMSYWWPGTSRMPNPGTQACPPFHALLTCKPALPPLLQAKLFRKGIFSKTQGVQAFSWCQMQLLSNTPTSHCS